MKAYAHWWVAVVGLLFLAFPAVGQEAGKAENAAPPAEKEHPTRSMIEMETWLAQPSGLDYAAVAVVDPTNPFETKVLNIDHGVTDRMRYRFGYSLPGSIGDVVLTWWSHDDLQAMDTSTPGDFQYQALLTPPAFAGVFDDGLSDGYSFTARTITRDLRLDYYREAFRLPKVTGRWYLGYRRVTHHRSMDTEYFAVAPNLPPILPPLPPVDLTPRPDTATSQSGFNGRGIEAGLEVTVPVSRTVQLEFGAGAATLRGKMNAKYQALTSLYISSQTGDVDQVIEAPFDEFNDPDLIGNIQQVAYPVALRIDGESSTAQVLEGYLSVRWRVWKTLDLFAGFRNLRYDNVGVEIRPAFVSRDVVGHTFDVVEIDGQPRSVIRGMDVQGLTRSPRSTGYEGWYAGLTYRY